MQNEIDPAVGRWYQHLDDGTLFRVTAVDEDEDLVEFQDFDGDLGEVSLDEWHNWNIEVTDAPEDWTGPVDDVEPDDLEYSEIRSEGERRGLPEERRRQDLQDTGLPGEPATGLEDQERLVEGRTASRGSPAGERRMARGPSRETPAAGPRPERGAAQAQAGRRADGLGPDRINEVKKRLTGRAGELRLDIQRELRKYDNESYTRLAERVADPGDQAWSDLVSDLNLAEVTRDVGEMRRIELALQRLAEGRYGICISCGEGIDPERLEVNPAAVRCLECQREFESRSRRSRPSL